MEIEKQLQNTRFNQFQEKIGEYLSTSIVGPWSRRSITLISLLLGYYLGSNLTVYFLQVFRHRTLVVLFMVILIEILIRLRTNVSRTPWPISWLAIDNVRIGAVYSVCLEAFKLGS